MKQFIFNLIYGGLMMIAGIFFGSNIVYDGIYEEGVKDCLSGKAKYEIKQDTLISR